MQTERAGGVQGRGLCDSADINLVLFFSDYNNMANFENL